MLGLHFISSLINYSVYKHVLELLLLDKLLSTYWYVCNLHIDKEFNE
jgi:hypothetical protein